MASKFSFVFSFVIIFLLLGCKGQLKKQSKLNSININPKELVGGPFENNEFMYIDMPKTILATDTSAAWNNKGTKLLITGTVFNLDGKTPAPNVIIYYYHTNADGIYANSQNLNPKALKHGYIRGWVKTDTSGHYAIYTNRPAPYPNTNFEAHIHINIKEPNSINEYYIDEFVFDDDSLLTSKKRNNLQNRGGSGVLRVLHGQGIQIAEHNIILGLNIPNYPQKMDSQIVSGLNIGEDQPSFIPYHAYGPDKGTQTCPVCKYGRYFGIMLFVGNNPNWEHIKKWLLFLEQQSILKQSNLKVYFVYGNSNNYNKLKREKELTLIGEELHLKNTALTFVPSYNDAKTEAFLNKINPSVESTIIIYKNRSIVNKLINEAPTDSNFKVIENSLIQNQGIYFNLKE